jgi:hypothetical protein
MGKHTPVHSRAHLGGSQDIYRFENGYGASVVNHRFSYGTELAVVRFTGANPTDFRLCYDTPVTDDVIGHLNNNTLSALLDQIAALPVPEAA